MSRGLVCLWTVVVIGSAAILVATGARAAEASAQARRARADLRMISDQAAELAGLRRARSEFPDKPEGGLATKVSAAMARAGLASNILQSLSPEAAAIGDAGSRLSRQRATLTMANLSLPQVGKFLDAWRRAEPDWTISGIDLSPINSKDSPSIGTDLPLRAVITMEGVFKNPPRAGASR